MPKQLNSALNRIRKVFLVITAFLLLLSVFSTVKVRNMMSIDKAVKEADDVKESLSRLLVLVMDAEAAQREYLLTRDPQYLQFVRLCKTDLPARFAQVKHALSGNVQQLSNLAELKLFVDKKMARLELPADSILSKPGGLAADKLLLAKVKEKIVKMEAREKQVLEARENSFSEYLFLTPALWYTLVGSCLVILTFSFITIRRELRNSLSLQEQLIRQNHVMHTLIDSSFDIITSFDMDFKVTMVNRRASEFYKKEREDILGKPFPEVLPTATDGQTFANIRKAMKGETIYVPQIKSIINEGVFEQFFVPLKNDKGETTGVLMYAHEITVVIKAETQLKQLNQELTQKNSELELKNHELASFAYISSHDLQEPLRKIQSFTDLITSSEKDRLSKTGMDYFSRMQKAASRMQALINDLLTYSRAGTTERVFENVDLEALIEEIRSELKENLAAKQGVIETSELPVVSIIRFQFQQLFTNLISNSLKFSKAEEAPKISIRAEKMSEPPEGMATPEPGTSVVHIIYTDNGIGFEPQYNKSVFELFYRLHGRSEYSGTGIGLAICKKIIDNHHGLITAAGAPGEGVRFDIYIPSKLS